MFLNNYLRMDFFPNLDRWTEQFWDLYPFLVQHYNIQYQGCSEYISAVSADLVDAQILHINPGVPLLNSRRIARCNLGPLEYAVLRIRTDVMELCITMGPNLESNFELIKKSKQKLCVNVNEHPTIRTKKEVRAKLFS